MMTDRTAILLTSWEVETEEGGGCLNLPPFPISSLIFALRACSISLHLVRMSSSCRLRLEFYAHSLNCIKAYAYPAVLRISSMAMRFTRGMSDVRSSLYLALMACSLSLMDIKNIL
jgi:hypothetical protein